MVLSYSQCLSVLLVAVATVDAFSLPPRNAFAPSIPGNRQETATLGRSPYRGRACHRRRLDSSSIPQEASESEGTSPTLAGAPVEDSGDAGEVGAIEGAGETTSGASTIFVAGGSGFVGSQVCQQLVDAGCNVAALSRSGAPKNGEPWVQNVRWIKGNAVNQETYREELRESDTVVSCVGGFGATSAYMDLVNGDTNVKLAEAAAEAGVKRFVYVSVHDYRAPEFVKRVGYFSGKRRAEKVVGELFGSKGVILKPAFIYGEREVTIEGPDGTERRLTLPLQRVGRPLERILSTGIARTIAESGLPLADLTWTQPLSADSVAKSIVRCCLDDGPEQAGGESGKDPSEAVVLRIRDISRLVA